MLDDRSYMREPAYSPGWSAALVLVIANGVVFFLQLLTSLAYGPLPANPFERYLALVPGDLARGWIWQLLTFQFLHAGPLHLILNCVMLWMFGRQLEITLGKARFLQLYFISGTLGGLLQVVCSWVFPSHFGPNAVMGASAGVFGLMAAFAALNWNQPITALVAFILPVTMKAKYLLLILGILGVLGVMDRGSGIAHAAHLGGMAAGLAFVQFYARSEHRWLDRDSWHRSTPRRELVRTTSQRRSLWQKPDRQPSDDLPSAEFISREVDPILDKISAHGIQSLTDRERRILEAARARMSKR